MGNPLVSMIVPVYNVEPYLKQCVSSVSAQTYANLQIILVDDGSTDGCGQMCDDLAKADTRILVIHKENGGLGSARNAGLDAARGDYVYFVDGDDWVSGETVEKTLPFVERDGYDQCAWGMYIVEEGKPAYYTGRWEPLPLHFSKAEEKRQVLCRWFLSSRLSYSACTRAYRRDIIEKNGLRFQSEREIFAEDLDFNLRYMAVSRSLYYSPQGFYYYRQRDGSLMHTGVWEVRIAHEICMIRRQDGLLSQQEAFRPFYSFGGVTLAMILGDYVRGKPSRQRIAQVRAFCQDAADWDYLKEQARLASGDRRGLVRDCGWFLGRRVHAFYQYLLGGSIWPLYGCLQMRKWYEHLRGVKAWLHRR